MPDYRRCFIPGGTYFFTVALLERKGDLLVRHIAALREAVRRVKRLYPFEILAWVVLPEHLHCIWRLPDQDTDYPKRWRLIKLLFCKQIPKKTSGCLPCGETRASVVSGSDDIGNIRSARNPIFWRIWITCISTR
ncbi:MAG: hypothetical protein RJA63_2519 [Pseudomonadota bacterium]|jgi:REP element-mobilizing transposase RayT